MKKTKNLRTLLSLLITLGFIFYLFHKREFLLHSLEGIKPGFFILVIIGHVCVQLSNSFILRASLQPLDVKLGRFESFKLTTISSFVNFFTPVVGGASAKAVYLKSRHGLQYATFASAIYANYIITFCVSFFLGAVGVFFIHNAIHNHVGLLLILIFSGGFIASLMFIVFGHLLTSLLLKYSPNNRLIKAFNKKVQSADVGWKSIRQDKLVVFKVFFWSFVLMFSLMLIYWAATNSLGFKADIGSYMIFTSLASVTLLFNFTPGGIGVRETLYSSVYKITGIGVQQVVAFSLIDRAVQLLVLGIAWILFGNSIVKSIDIKNTQSAGKG